MTNKTNCRCFTKQRWLRMLILVFLTQITNGQIGSCPSSSTLCNTKLVGDYVGCISEPGISSGQVDFDYKFFKLDAIEVGSGDDPSYFKVTWQGQGPQAGYTQEVTFPSQSSANDQSGTVYANNGARPLQARFSFDCTNSDSTARGLEGIEFINEDDSQWGYLDNPMETYDFFPMNKNLVGFAFTYTDSQIKTIAPVWDSKQSNYLQCDYGKMTSTVPQTIEISSVNSLQVEQTYTINYSAFQNNDCQKSVSLSGCPSTMTLLNNNPEFTLRFYFTDLALEETSASCSLIVNPVQNFGGYLTPQTYQIQIDYLKCEYSSLSFDGQVITDTEYTIGTGLFQSIAFDPVSYSPTCISVIAYSYQVFENTQTENIIIDPVPSWITLDPLTNTMHYNSCNQTDAGSYKVKVTAYQQAYPNVNTSFDYDLTIIDNCPNALVTLNPTDNLLVSVEKISQIRTFVATNQYGTCCGPQNYTITTKLQPEPIWLSVDTFMYEILSGEYRSWINKQTVMIDVDVEYADQIVSFPGHFNITALCILYDLPVEPSAQIQDHVYFVNSGLLSTQSFNFIQVPDCSYTLQFAYSVQDSNQNVISPSPNWISFNSQDRKFTFNSKNSKDVGMYTITVKASHQKSSPGIFGDFSYVLDLQSEPTLIKQVGKGPIFTEQLPTEFSVFYGEPFEFRFPEMVLQDLSIGDQSMIYIIGNLGKAYPFSTFKNETKVFRIEANDTDVTNLGNYTLKFTLMDENASKTDYFISLNILDRNILDEFISKKQVKDKSQYDSYLEERAKLRAKYANLNVPPLKCSIEKMTAAGKLYLQFSNKMYIPKDFSILTFASPRDLADEPTKVNDSKSFLQVSLITQDNIPSKSKFEWELEDFSQEELILQIKFENPVSIGYEEQEFIKVAIKKENPIFFDEFGQEFNEDIVLIQQIPTQLGSSNFDLFLETNEETIVGGSKIAFAGSFLLNASLAASLQQLWQLLEAQQFILLYPLFAIKMPANAQKMFNLIMQIAAFEFFDMTDILSNWFNIPITEPLNQNFWQVGMETSMFILNLGTLWIFIIIYPILITVRFLSKGLQMCTNSARMEKIHKKLTDYVYWRYFCTLVKEQFFMFVISAQINIYKPNYETNGAITSTCLAYIALLFFVIYPLIMTRILSTNRKKLVSKTFLSKYGSTYDGLDPKKDSFYWQPLFFSYRRILLPVTVIYMQEIFILQYIAMSFTIIAQIIFIGWYAPFKEKLMNKLEIGHEIVLIILMYHILCFTPWFPDVELAPYIGLSCIIVVAIHFVSFLFLQIGFTIVRVKTMLRQRYALRIAKVSLSRSQVLQRHRKMAVVVHNNIFDRNLKREIRQQLAEKIANQFTSSLQAPIEEDSQESYSESSSDYYSSNESSCDKEQSITTITQQNDLQTKVIQSQDDKSIPKESGQIPENSIFFPSLDYLENKETELDQRRTQPESLKSVPKTNLSQKQYIPYSKFKPLKIFIPSALSIELQRPEKQKSSDHFDPLDNPPTLPTIQNKQPRNNYTVNKSLDEMDELINAYALESQLHPQPDSILQQPTKANPLQHSEVKALPIFDHKPPLLSKEELTGSCKQGDFGNASKSIITRSVVTEKIRHFQFV